MGGQTDLRPFAERLKSESLRAGATTAGEKIAAAPAFIEVVAERTPLPTIVVRVGAADIEVRPAFDARLLREVAEALAEGT